MNVISPLGILMELNTVPLGNLLWVDAVNGSDSIAGRGRMVAAFKTLTAAKNAAEPASGSFPGDTIVVLPGKYTEKNLLKNGVDWHFMNGALVEYAGSSDGAIFDTSADGTNSAVSSVITGHGAFSNLSNSGTAHVVHANKTDNLIIQGRLMNATDECVKISASSSVVRIEMADYMHSANGAVIWLTGSASDTIVKVPLIHASSGPCVLVEGGAASIYAHLLRGYSGVDGAIVVSGGSGATFISSYEIFCNSKPAIQYSASAAKLMVRGARIVTAASGSDGNGIEISGSYGNDAIRIPGCIIVASGTYSINAPGLRRVHTLGAYGNKAANNLTQIGAWATDANIN